MKLEQIGFYTLTDERAKSVSETSRMQRCEIIITEKCNFKCPYCRGLRSDCSGVKTLEEVKEVIDYWADDNLKNIRFSGGEPTTHKNLLEMVEHAKARGVERIAISTNGSSSEAYYRKLVQRALMISLSHWMPAVVLAVILWLAYAASLVRLLTTSRYWHL